MCVNVNKDKPYIYIQIQEYIYICNHLFRYTKSFGLSEKWHLAACKQVHIRTGHRLISK